MKNVFRFFLISVLMLTSACEKEEQVYEDDAQLETRTLNAQIQDCRFEPIDSEIYAGDNLGFNDGNLSSALFNQPFALVYDEHTKTIYVSDTGNNRIRVIRNGMVSTLVGGIRGDRDGIGTAARLDSPMGIVIDKKGNLYVADSGNHKIKKITPQGLTSTFAGSIAGYVNGRGVSARFNFPTGIAYDNKEGVFYVTDTRNDKIRLIKSDASVGLLAGSTAGYRDSNNRYAARFDSPQGIEFGPDGALYVADFFNHKIRRVTKTGRTSTFAGSRIGSVNGHISRATFTNPTNIVCDQAGNFFITDGSDPSDNSSLFGYNARVRFISGNKVGLLAGRADYNSFSLTENFLYPKGMAIIKEDLYITNSGLGQIKRIDLEYDCN